MKDKNKTQSWYSLAFIWGGSMVCVPSLLIGSTLVSGMSLGKALLVGLIGYAITVVIMILQGTQTNCSNCKTGIWRGRIATNHFHYFSDCLLRMVWYPNKCRRSSLCESFRSIRYSYFSPSLFNNMGNHYACYSNLWDSFDSSDQLHCGSVSCHRVSIWPIRGSFLWTRQPTLAGVSADESAFIF